MVIARHARRKAQNKVMLFYIYLRPRGFSLHCRRLHRFEFPPPPPPAITPALAVAQHDRMPPPHSLLGIGDLHVCDDAVLCVTTPCRSLSHTVVTRTHTIYGFPALSLCPADRVYSHIKHHVYTVKRLIDMFMTV